jgi:molybdopterin molybdotransferase
MKIYGVTGWKNAGKTGLMERLVAEFTARGFRVATLKHAHHAFDVDQPGKDSFRHRTAGAHEVILASHKRWALMSELRDGDEPPLHELLAKLNPADLVLIEGWKAEDHPKVEAYRASCKNPLIAPGDRHIRAVAADTPVEIDIPQFDLDDTGAIADFIAADLGLSAARTPAEPPAKGPRDDCFALPPGVDWMPVDTALGHLRAALNPVVATEITPVAGALGRVLAADAVALRANPPAANSAVDGYGFAHAATGEGRQDLPLFPDRAAAGAPFTGAVPQGQAIRILTGALIPECVDTVVLEEDCQVTDTAIAFDGPVKKGANLRRAGEDVQSGETALAKGRKLTPGDLGLLTALGLAEVTTFAPLRVGVLSTGDEIAQPGALHPADKTYDANRPMLLAMLSRMGFAPVDLGHVADDVDFIRQRLDQAAQQTDAILTSGGASAGDEDHVSALLRAEGNLTAWRIALKPGRPLALATWKSVPVFGLPGNPVAAFVCTAIFARPALSQMSGAGWVEPRGYEVAAAFSKTKKPGRREYLRARLTANGAAEVFKSEGSGRISGLSWATGLVELGDNGRDIRPGDKVRYIPFSEFGL